jgi:signal transduction histidine kinase
LLEPFSSGKKIAYEKIEYLERKIEDQNQLAKLRTLRDKIAEKVRDTERLINYRNTLTLEIAIQEISKTKDKAVMDEIRNDIADLKREELRLLDVREENLKESIDNNFWLMILGSLIGTGFISLAIFVMLFEMQKRQNAEIDLRDANKELENRVEERTEELQKANLELLGLTDQKERLLADEKHARREAEIANRLRDEFMAMISHELRTPLNSILGWARIMKRGNVDDQTQTKAASTIIKNAETQNRLITDLLDVARIISGKLTLELHELNFPELVQTSLETVKPSADTKEIPIVLKIDENAENIRINGDANRLQQIIWNLLTNAIKFTHEKGEIYVSLFRENSQIILKIKDNGIGISEEFLPYVFERFRQDQANVAKSGGLGLGLTIVRYLTEMHGGTVDVESEGENQGATFTVCLPMIE